MATQSGTQSFVDTKITLIKKSGPGVLIGLVEQVSKNGYVDFSGLQFELPGEYVISVISDSNTIENTEITITVLPQDDIIPQDDKVTTEQKPIEGTRPIIAQIDKPSVKLSPIEFDGTDQKHDNEVAVGLGFTPFFWYNGYQVSDRDISSLNLYYDGILPKVSIIFIDSVGFMKKDGFPLDDAKFELFLNSGSKNLKSIHLKFKLENFQENKGKSYTIIGTLDLKDFYKIAFKSYRGTSFEVLRKISGELELGFNSNITNTVDSMNWVNNGKLSKDFFLNIINHSYISDTSYVLGYIDFYYCFNYVDIEKEWLRDISNDVGLNSTGINHLNNESDKDKIEQLILTNDKSMNTSPFYFSGYKLNNNSTQISLTKGYFTRSKVYDSISKQFLIFDVNSQTSDGSKTHILKGAANDTKDIIENYRTNYSGKMDTENVYKNYYYSETQNKVNLDNLVRISVDITLPNPNFNLYKFMKIQLVFVNPMSSPSNDEVVQSRLTGEWVIVDIGYVWTKGKLTQTLNLVRKEIGKTTEEIESDKNKSTGNPEVNTENNENPIINSDVVGYTQSVVLPTDEGTFVFGEEQDTELSDEYTDSEFYGDAETELVLEKYNEDTPTVIVDATSDEIITGKDYGAIVIGSGIFETIKALSKLKYVIGKEESHNNYNVANTGGAAKKSKTNVNGLNFDSLKKYQNIKSPDNSERVFAAGRFQIIPDTMKTIKNGIGLRGSDIFGPETQEKMGDWLLLNNRRELSNYIKGKNNGSSIDLANAINQIGYEWASMPVVIKSSGKKLGDVIKGIGQSGNYGGIGNNPNVAKVSVKTMAKLLVRARIEYGGGIPIFIPSYYA